MSLLYVVYLPLPSILLTCVECETLASFDCEFPTSVECELLVSVQCESLTSVVLESHCMSADLLVKQSSVVYQFVLMHSTSCLACRLVWLWTCMTHAGGSLDSMHNFVGLCSCTSSQYTLCGSVGSCQRCPLFASCSLKLPSMKIQHSPYARCFVLGHAVTGCKQPLCKLFTSCLNLRHALQVCSYSGKTHDALRGHNALQGHNSMCSAGRLDAACYDCWGHGLQL